MHPVSRRSAVAPFLAMDVLAEANRLKATGRDIVSLAVGQPSDPAPRAALDAARDALAIGRIGYTDALGLTSLRTALAAYYESRHGVSVDPSRIAVTTGSSAAFTLAFLAAFDAGATIAIARPGYPAYRNIIAALGMSVHELPVGETGGLITPDHVREAARTRQIDGLLVASPANPTGSVMTKQEAEALFSCCAELGIRVISDEIYHNLNHVGQDLTALELGDDAIVINSFSKYYCMTGWRIGWMVVPENMIRAIERLQQNLFISAPELSQIAAEAALGARDELDRVRDRYKANRALLLDALPRLGMPFASPPDGAFYAWCDVSAHTNDSMDFSRRILNEIGVAAPSGLDFDPVEGARLMRFSYAGSTRDIETALERLSGWLA